MARSWTARAGAAAAYGGVVAIGLWALIRLAGWDSHYPVAQLMAFTPYIAVAAANLLFGAADPTALVATVIRLRIDVLAVQEMTPQWLARADAAGLAGELPYRIAVPAGGASGSGVFARYPIEATGHREEWFYQAFGVIRLPDGHTVRVESAHVASPFDRPNTPHWVRTLRREPRANPKAVTPQVLLGDFNATLDHSLLRGLIDSGYRDAASVAGKGWSGTWGWYDGDPIPPVIIDHVLADRRIGVRGVYVYAVKGSDHRMVVAELVLP